MVLSYKHGFRSMMKIKDKMRHEKHSTLHLIVVVSVYEGYMRAFVFHPHKAYVPFE